MISMLTTTPYFPPITLDELVADYLRVKLLRPQAAKAYRSKAGTVVARLGLQFAHEIGVQEVVRYRDALLQDGRSVATWNTNRRHLIALWRHGIRFGFFNHCPWSMVAAGPEPTTNKIISSDALKTVMNAISASDGRFLPHAFWRAVTMTLILTAMRRSQLINLIWSDVIIEDTPRLRLRVDTRKRSRKYEVPLCHRLQDLLTEFRRTALAFWGSAQGFEESQVFHIKLHLGLSGAENTPCSLTNDALSQFFRRLAKHSGVRISTQRLRNRTATVMLENGTNVRTIQDLLGLTAVPPATRFVWPDLAKVAIALDSLAKVDADLFS